MNSKRLNLVLIGLVCLMFIGLVGGAYKVNSLVSGESKKLSDLKAKDKALAQQQDGLKLAKKGLADYTELGQIARTVVPEDKSQAETVRQLSNIAGANGIKLASITFPASTLGATTPTTGLGTKPSTPVPAPSATASKNSQLTLVPNIPGVYQLPITVTSDSKQPSPYYKFINFLADLENNRRTSQVTNISIEPNKVDSNYVSFTITLNEYIKP